MSSKHGPAQIPDEHYPTPAWLVDRLLEAVDLPGGHWLEPSAGDGAIIRAVNARRQDVQWTAVELRPMRSALLCAAVDATGKTPAEAYKPPIVHSPQDFLTLPLSPKTVEITRFAFDVAIGNPPYSLAREFIDRCLCLAAVVVFPLRLNFLGSEARADWFRKIGMPDVFVTPNRPDYSGNGGDSCEYSWMLWNQVQPARAAQVRLLATTPRAVRVAQKPGR